jgi:hypothetical protein
MSVENLAIMQGLYTRRTQNYELRLLEPWPASPSDDPTRLYFTYMHFFGIWAAIMDRVGLGGLQVSLQDTVSSPQVLFARDQGRPVDAPLRTIHCIYPHGDALELRAGRPCRSSWQLLSYEQQCAVRSQAWLDALTPAPKSLFEIHVESDLAAPASLAKPWLWSEEADWRQLD